MSADIADLAFRMGVGVAMRVSVSVSMRVAMGMRVTM